MKKILTLFFALLFPLLSFAIDFQGVEIKGKGRDFVKALESHGFRFISKSKDKWILKGKVMEENAEVSVICDYEDEVERIHSKTRVEDWESLLYTYVGFAVLLKHEIGEPFFIYDFRTSPPEDKEEAMDVGKIIFHQEPAFLWMWKKDECFITLFVSNESPTIILEYEI